MLTRKSILNYFGLVVVPLIAGVMAGVVLAFGVFGLSMWMLGSPACHPEMPLTCIILGMAAGAVGFVVAILGVGLWYWRKFIGTPTTGEIKT